MANEAFQRWFDTGSSLSRLEWWNLWISRVISFPLVVWTFLLHPARINTAVWLAFSGVNSLLWALVIYRGVRWLLAARPSA
jgi:hypothetical protein